MDTCHAHVTLWLSVPAPGEVTTYPNQNTPPVSRCHALCHALGRGLGGLLSGGLGGLGGLQVLGGLGGLSGGLGGCLAL